MKKATLTERYSGVQIACWLLESALMLTSVGFFIAALVAAIQAGATGKPLGSELFRLMICAEAILFLFVPYILNALTKGKLRLPPGFEMVYALYAFCGTIVGDMLNAFAVIPFWDSIMHAFSGVVLCYVGYLLADIFNQKQIQKGGQLNAYFLALFAVCFAVALGAVWELFEYASDGLLGTNSQQFMETTTGTFVTDTDIPLVGHLALRDTMKDMFLNTLGAVAAAVAISLYRIGREKKNAVSEAACADGSPFAEVSAEKEAAPAVTPSDHPEEAR